MEVRTPNGKIFKRPFLTFGTRFFAFTNAQKVLTFRTYVTTYSVEKNNELYFPYFILKSLQIRTLTAILLSHLFTLCFSNQK